ncbi:hypothetical protein KRX52_02035 [Pseudomonas sp. MAP12]|uniref:Uncharacterized protein n=1 Tax=Geopseudomonas aromaticivorans TaxID=2849492 RepID=A0ABS6MRZ9_9GAMM|nr:hypothetical protein [Pseudomonas aromaticivorans]MBV2131573.1 hypothetical protein [Pseudomonas aromaticivorans]
MSRYSKGETSQAKLQEKQAKTQSLLTKTILIKDAVKDNRSIPSLDIHRSKRGVSFKSVLAWVDPELDITSCSYNTSREPYNIEYSDQLSAALNSYNKQSKSHADPPPKPRLTKRSQSEEIANLKGQIESLQNALGEIYRAYMQLTTRVDEQTRQDLRYQQVLKSHTRALNRAHLTLVKP